jgi:hypothetical protein
MKFYGDYQVYSDSGVDLTLLQGNLRRTETNRVRASIAAAKSFWGLRPSWRRADRKVLVLEAEQIFEQLHAYHVEYVVVGALAMAVHGSAYVGESFDLCYQTAEANIHALLRALKPFHPCSPGRHIADSDLALVRERENVAVTTDLGDINLFGALSRLGSYDEVLRQSVERVLFDIPVRVLGVDGLIASKKCSGIVGDALHVLELEELKKMKDCERAQA